MCKTVLQLALASSSTGSASMEARHCANGMARGCYRSRGSEDEATLRTVCIRAMSRRQELVNAGGDFL
jgi:hypothetical protein